MRLILALLVAAGLALRFASLTLPDISTDEAQFALGASAAQPLVGMQFFDLGQRLFGEENAVVRAVAGAWGILGVALLAAIGLVLGGRKTAAVVGLIALFFPSHVVFSRLAYLSAPLTAWWLAVLLMFLVAEKRTTPQAIIGLYGVSFVATFIKTQAFLLPLALLLYRAVRLRGKIVRDPLAWALALSMIPIMLYIAAHPGILATVAQYGGNQYGLLDVGGRLFALAMSAWSIMGIGLFVCALATPALRTMPAPWWIALTVGIGQGYVLGPENAYYMTDLVLLALPIGIALASSRRMILAGTACAIAIFIAASLMTISTQRRHDYWETHAGAINEALADADAVIVLGNAGHHLRWYIEPYVLVGKDMNIEDRSGYFLLLDPSERDRISGGEVVYKDGVVTIVRN